MRMVLAAAILIAGCSTTESTNEPRLVCEAYEMVAEVPSCSVRDMRSDLAAPMADDVVSFSGPIDPSTVGEDYVRVLDVYRDPTTGEFGGRFVRRDGSCGFTPCVFEYRDTASALAPCGDPPLIPAIDVTVDNETVSMAETSWNDLLAFQDKYDAWAICVLRAVQP